MKKRNYADFIGDILDCIDNINEITQNITCEEFVQSKTVYPATERYFEIIGEAAKRIPKDLQDQYPEIPWREIIGMRNVIIHTYDNVIAEILWDTIKTKILPLRSSLNKMLKELEK